MKLYIYPLLSAFIMFHTIVVSSQTLFNNGTGSAMIRADVNSKSALVTNTTDLRGDLSQLLGTGVIKTDDQVMECRSFLAFDLSKIPSYFTASDILLAQLVLFPLRMEDEDRENIPSIELAIKRVKEYWSDSMVSWNNQPVIDEESVSLIKLNGGRLEKSTVIRVTNQVRQMFREGNYGFMISAKGEKETNTDFNWFGSSRNELQNVRPVLMIYFKVNREEGTSGTPLTPMANLRLRDLDQQYQGALEQYKVSRQANPSGVRNTGNNPPKPVDPGSGN